MKFLKFYFVISFLSILNIVSGQVTTNKFEKFAIKQDSLFIQAYEQRDTKTYDKLLKELLLQYNKLNTDDKKFFSRFLNGAYYNFTCTYSIMNNKQTALEYLKKSIVAGYSDYLHLLIDKDLDNIRNENEFKIIVNSLKSNYDYLYVLKKADKYNISDNRQLPIFTYQSSDNPNLTILRKAYNLDSIAGKGTDVLKIINLLHWIHNLIPHDGNHGNPAVKDALNLIKTCKIENRGLNCRGLATVLNECYLSLGIKSRIVTCLPKDSMKIDNDCHVINLVYSNNLNKWLWIDPTNNAYIMNEKGELLSIEEVRERIINSRPLILNPDANWNNQRVQTKEEYLLNYMAKNLYMLECPADSKYNLEIRDEGKTYNYITLLPLDYYEQTPDKTEMKYEKMNLTIFNYKTNNPKLFWQIP